MRVRDFISYIIIGAVLLITTALLAILAIVPTNKAFVNQAINQTTIITETKMNYIESNLEKLEQSFLLDKESIEGLEILEHNDLISNPNELFTKTSLIIKESDIFHQIIVNDVLTYGPNGAVYSIYLYDNITNTYGRVKIDYIFTNYETDVNYYIYVADGEILASNDLENKTTNFYTLIRNNSTEDDANNIKNEIVQKNEGQTYTINYGDYYLCTLAFENIYYAQRISNNGSSLGIKPVINLIIVYSLGIILVNIMLYLVILLGFKKASKIINVDDSNFSKAKSLIIRLDKNGNILRINKTLKSLLGPKLKLTDIKMLKPEKNLDIKDCIKKETEFVVSILNADKKTLYFDFVSIKNRKDYYLIGYDVSKQYLNNQMLLKMSSKNTTTNMENLLALQVAFPSILELAVDHKITFAFINIVGFRDINKVFGREVGDKVLQSISQTIAKIFAKMKLYHAEADNFIVVVGDPEERVAGSLCQKLMETLKQPIVVNRNQIFLHAKIGLYDVDLEQTPALSFADVRRKLELAATKAKSSNNKDIISYDSSLEYVLSETNRMQIDLQNAIKKDEFILKYQPQYDIFENKIVSFEALIRWNNPMYINQSPQAFIELAEQRGYILEIGDFVIRESFKAAKILEAYNCHVSINVSPAQILQAGFVTELIQEFHKNQLQPGSIAIEITETFVMENFNIVVNKLQMLQKEGFSIHLDDFGTGYSSMLYLKDLPCDTIKIDKEFTKGVETSKFNYVMVQNICKMGLDLGLNIICEGIEKQEQSNILKKFGCRIIQGWLIGKAVPLTEAIELIEFHNTKKPSSKVETVKTATTKTVTKKKKV